MADFDPHSLDVVNPGPLARSFYSELIDVIGREAAGLIVGHYDGRRTLRVPHPIPENHELISLVGRTAAECFADYCLGDAVQIRTFALEVRKVFGREATGRHVGRLPSPKGGLAARMRAEAPDDRLRAKIAAKIGKPRKPRKPTPRQLLKLKLNREIAEAIESNQKAFGSMRREILAHRFGVSVSKILSVYELVKQVRKEDLLKDGSNG